MSGAIRVVYLANVGTRDVTLDGQPLRVPRADGEQLLREYDAVRDRLDAPILMPGLRHAVQVAGRVDRLVLFYSDQPETTPPRFRDYDTIYLAQVLQRWLGGHPELDGKLGKVMLQPIRGNPADYNNTIPYYRQVLPQLVPADVATVYVAPVGGADASNVALWLAAVRHFGRTVEVIYVMPDGRVETLPLARLLLTDYRRQHAQALLDHYDYPALARFLQESPELGNAWLVPLAQALAERLHFNFRAAVEHLDRALEMARGEARARLERLRESLTACVQAVPPPRSDADQATWEQWLTYQRRGLEELYWNLRIKAEREEWVDFLGRVFRLVEGLQRYIFERETRHSTEKYGDGFPDFARWLEANASVRAYLVEQNVREPIEPNTFVLLQILNYWVEKAGRGRVLGKAYNVLKRLRQLSDLRNKSIMAHGWEGVSRREVEAVAQQGVGTLLEEIRQALESVGVEVPATNPFREINNWMRECLTRE